jgi:hypothetical protein
LLLQSKLETTQKCPFSVKIYFTYYTDRIYCSSYLATECYRATEVDSMCRELQFVTCFQQMSCVYYRISQQLHRLTSAPCLVTKTNNVLKLIVLAVTTVRAH